MFKTASLSEKLWALILGGVALFGILIAQTSANACIAWFYEQPKIPKSLIKND